MGLPAGTRLGVLFAVPFDLRHMKIAGAPVPVIEGVARTMSLAVASFDVSETGALVYIPGSVSTSSAQNDLALLDRKGSVDPLRLPPAPSMPPRVSPDGKRVAVSTDDGKEANVWIYELSGASAMRRLTFGGRNRFPVWTADGQRVAFQSDREGDAAIFWQRADGNGPAERLTKPEQGTSHVPDSWSPKNDALLFQRNQGVNDFVVGVVVA